MTNRDVNRMGVRSGSQRRTDRLPLLKDWPPVTTDLRDGFMFSNEKTLRNPDRWDIKQDAQMAGKTKTSGMRQAMTIAQDQVRRFLDFPKTLH